MIKILIVEDNLYKLDIIRRLIKENIQIIESNVHSANNVVQAKQLLFHNKFDLMILDLVLPSNDDDKNPTPEKGVKFLEEIHYNPSLKPPIHIIGLTEFSDFKNMYSGNFEKHLWLLIHYDASSEEWRDKLINILSHLYKLRKDFLENKSFYKFDIALITALRNPELEQVLQLSDNWEEFTPENDFVKYYITNFGEGENQKRIVAASADQLGMVASTSLATKIIYNFTPRYLIMVGIAAGVNKSSMNFGDILIADQTWDYSSGKLIDINGNSNEDLMLKFLPEPKASALSPELRAKILSYSQKKDVLDKIQNSWAGKELLNKLQVFIGPIGCGSYVISSRPFVESIKEQQRKLIGIEMEGYGVYYAAEHSPNPKTQALLIKSISDFANTKKGDDYQKYASYTSARFAYNFILDEL